MKYLGINLVKYIPDLYIQIWKTKTTWKTKNTAKTK